MTESLIYIADPEDVIVPEKRQRTKFDMTKLKELEASIEKLGQLQPGVCCKEGEKIILIAGHRRLMACKNLEIGYRYELLEEIKDPMRRKLMEFHENLMREQLDFKDEARTRAEFHAFLMKTRGLQKVKGKPSWSLEKTANELGISKTSLRDDVEYTEFAKNIPAVAVAKTRSEASKTIKRLKNQVIQNETLRQIKQEQIPDEDQSENLSEKERLKQKLKCAVDNYSKHIYCGKFIDVLNDNFVPETFDICFFDPPWGVNFDDVFQLSGKQQGYSDKRKDFFRTLETRLKTIYKFLKPDSILFMKFGITSHFWVVRTLNRLGFKTNGIPIIWHKKGSHRTRSPERYFGRSYEPILIAHKGSKPIQIQGKPDIISTATPTQKMKDIHPSAMHPKLLHTLLSYVGFPGDHVLDPMCGSGMTGVAAEALREQLQLNYTLIDKEESFCNLAIKNLIQGYANICDLANSPDTDDFKTLIPGSSEWVQYWTEHPEEREEMTEYAKERRLK